MEADEKDGEERKTRCQKCKRERVGGKAIQPLRRAMKSIRAKGRERRGR